MNDVQDIINTFARMEVTQKTNTLVLLVLELTIHARGIVMDLPPEIALQRLRGINELQHKISSQLSAYLTARTTRYPDGAFWSVLGELSVKSDLSALFFASVRTAFSRVQVPVQ